MKNDHTYFTWSSTKLQFGHMLLHSACLGMVLEGDREEKSNKK